MKVYNQTICWTLNRLAMVTFRKFQYFDPFPSQHDVISYNPYRVQTIEMANDDVMLGAEILKITKIHHHQSFYRPKISLSANFHDSTTFGSLVINLGVFWAPGNDDVIWGSKY